MQLNNKTIGASLAAAACSLLNQAQAADAVQANGNQNWTVDSALMYYAEDQGRIKDASARALITHTIDEDRSFTIGATVDTLTGASPSGAVKTDRAQTFTSPSGRGGYTTPANQTPLDSTFKDTRFAGTLSYTLPVFDASRLQVGGDASSEHDYLHLGGNLRLESDFNQKNTTLFGGVAYSYDTITPEGGIPVAFSALSNQRSNGEGEDDSHTSRGISNDTKTIVDGLLGVSQILSRRALLDVALSYSQVNGYMTDPYKFLSVVDGATGRLVNNPSNTSFGYYLYEKRPDKRAKESVYAELRYALDRDSFAVNYRFMTDDWGINSHTVEARYHWNINKTHWFEPQVRYYTQTAADFYNTVLIDGQTLPQYASADYRLAKLNTWTLGAKYAWQTRSGNEYSVRAEYYSQTPTESANSRIGILNNYSEIVPSMSAVLVQFGVKFGF